MISGISANGKGMKGGDNNDLIDQNVGLDW